MEKQTLFISYCWKDGNTYADELETQLKDVFDVKRDKSQLIANDDIFDFMAEIADSDNVIIVLTSEYVKSLNCMLEMSSLVSQEDWAMKAMVLVIDDSLYTIERKLEIINYWLLRQKKSFEGLNSVDAGRKIWEEEKGFVDQICGQVEIFFSGLSRRKNPSQIAIVNEIIKKSKRNKEIERDIVAKGEEAVLKCLEQYGQMTVKDLAERTSRTHAATRRTVLNLISKGEIERSSNNRKESMVRKKDK